MSQESVYNILKKDGNYMSTRRIAEIGNVSISSVHKAIIGLLARKEVVSVLAKNGNGYPIKLWKIRK
jgi:hypothetical protein